jgi:hypothetical protein
LVPFFSFALSYFLSLSLSVRRPKEKRSKTERTKRKKRDCDYLLKKTKAASLNPKFRCLYIPLEPPSIRSLRLREKDRETEVSLPNSPQAIERPNRLIEASEQNSASRIAGQVTFAPPNRFFAI